MFLSILTIILWLTAGLIWTFNEDGIPKFAFWLAIISIVSNHIVDILKELN